MKRNLYTFILSLCVLGFLNAQVPKKILIEETTQAGCGPCASLNPAFDALTGMNLDKVVVMKYQVWWPGFDPMYEENIADVIGRVQDYLGPNAAPNMYVNGGQPEAITAMTQARIDQLYNNETSPISITLDHNLNDATGEVDISVRIENQSTTDLPPNTYRLQTVLQEDEIIFPAPPSTNGETDFKFVMRKMLPDANGTLLTDGMAAGASLTFDFSVPIPWYTKDLGYLAATAWVENPTTRQVLQAEHSAHKPLMGVYPDLAYSYVYEGFDGYCDTEVDAVFTITNAGSEDVSSFDVAGVNPDGSLNVLESWTGTLAPGATEMVSVSGLVLPTGGSSLNAIVTNIDGRPDQNGHNGVRNTTQLYTINPDVWGEEISEGFDIQLLNQVPEHMLFEENNIPIVTANSTHIGGIDDSLGGFGNSDGAVWIDFPVAAPGNTASFLFEKIDLTESNNTTLDFNYAYALRGANGSDRVIVEVSEDCGGTWTTIWDVVGSTVTTAPATPTNTRFFPSPTQWGASESFDLSAFDGSAELMLRFRGISGGAQAFWFDDIILKSGPVSTQQELGLDNVKVYPNPASDIVNLDFSIEEAQDLNISITDLSGRMIQNIAQASYPAGSHTVNWTPQNDGVYLIQIASDKGVTSKRVTVVK